MLVDPVTPSLLAGQQHLTLRRFVARGVSRTVGGGVLGVLFRLRG